MAKKYTWEYEEITDSEEKVNHTIQLVCSNLTGKAIITIDGDEYDISVKPFSLRGTNQMFRLGEQAAIIDFPKKGEPTVTVDSVLLSKK